MATDNMENRKDEVGLRTAWRRLLRTPALSTTMRVDRFSPGPCPFRYQLDIYFVGDEIEGKNPDIVINVEDNPTTTMRCVIKKHQRKPCAIGLQPSRSRAERGEAS